MSKQHKKHAYDLVHDRAKIINTILICVLTDIATFITNAETPIMVYVCLDLAVILFQHGNNLIGWIIEHFLHLRHRHKKY